MCDTPNRPLNIENDVWGPRCVLLGQIVLSWYMYYAWYSQLAIEEHPITPNRPLSNGCIWQQYGEREIHQTLKTIPGALMSYFGTKKSSLDICIMCDTPKWPLRNTPLLPTGHWGIAVFDSNMRHMTHILYWKTSRRVIFDHQPARNIPLLPTGHWGTAAV